MHNLSLKPIILVCSALLIFASCVKTPDKVFSPSVKAGVVEGAEKKYSIFFTGGIKNENDSTALLNVEGNILFINDSGDTITSLPFKIPAILPFETGVIKEKLELSTADAEKLFSVLSIKTDKLGTPEEPGNRFLEEKNIKLSSIKSEKKDIVKLLGEKIR